MSKRLQVILKDGEYRDIQRAARLRHMTIGEWVRRALELARRQEPENSVGKKLEALRAATLHNFPTADIDQMLREIEQGYLSGDK